MTAPPRNPSPARNARSAQVARGPAEHQPDGHRTRCGWARSARTRAGRWPRRRRRCRCSGPRPSPWLKAAPVLKVRFSCSDQMRSMGPSARLRSAQVFVSWSRTTTAAASGRTRRRLRAGRLSAGGRTATGRRSPLRSPGRTAPPARGCPPPACSSSSGSCSGTAGPGAAKARRPDSRSGSAVGSELAPGRSGSGGLARHVEVRRGRRRWRRGVGPGRLVHVEAGRGWRRRGRGVGPGVLGRGRPVVVRRRRGSRRTPTRWRPGSASAAPASTGRPRRRRPAGRAGRLVDSARDRRDRRASSSSVGLGRGRAPGRWPVRPAQGPRSRTAGRRRATGPGSRARRAGRRARHGPPGRGRAGPRCGLSRRATSPGERVAVPLQGGQLVQQLRPLQVDGLADLGLGLGDGPFPVGPGLGGEALGLGLGFGHLAAGGLLGLGHRGVGGALGQQQRALDGLVALDVGPGRAPPPPGLASRPRPAWLVASRRRAWASPTQTSTCWRKASTSSTS